MIKQDKGVILLTTTSLQIQVQRKTIELKPAQLAVYKQSKVLEATDRNNSHYYLIFHKDRFINGIRRQHIRLNSYIHSAFTRGICFNGSHPVTIQLLNLQKSYPLISFNQLFKNIQKTHTKMEVALILSYFDSFTKQGSIPKLFKSTFYEYKRDGQNLLAFQLLKTFENYDRDNKFVHDMINDLHLQKYKSSYEELETIFEKDPLNFELAAYDCLDEKDIANLLIQLYEQQGRSIDELAIRCHQLAKRFSVKNLLILQTLMEDLPIKDRIRYLEDLRQTTRSPKVHESILQTALESGDPDLIVRTLPSINQSPGEKQLEYIIQSVEAADKQTLLEWFTGDGSQQLLKISNGSKKNLERIARPFVSAFLSKHPISDTLQWMEPFREAGIQLPVERKLKRMAAMKDDPDQQFELGELFLQFRLMDKSIDCFKWEMELRPDDPRPVTYLSKIYKEIGNTEESSVYQQLLIQMNK